MDNFVRSSDINKDENLKRRPQSKTISTRTLIPTGRTFKNKEDVDKFMKKFNGADLPKKRRPKKEEAENGN